MDEQWPAIQIHPLADEGNGDRTGPIYFLDHGDEHQEWPCFDLYADMSATSVCFLHEMKITCF